MNESDRKSVLEKIVEEINRVSSDIEYLKELTRPIPPDNSIGRLSRMEAINAKSVNEAALGAATLKLARLKGALTRIDQPEFGLCRECGEPIPLGRILLIPESTMCVSCAS